MPILFTLRVLARRLLRENCRRNIFFKSRFPWRIGGANRKVLASLYSTHMNMKRTYSLLILNRMVIYRTIEILIDQTTVLLVGIPTNHFSRSCRCEEEEETAACHLISCVGLSGYYNPSFSHHLCCVCLSISSMIYRLVKFFLVILI